jgi:hypothetical protein
MTNPKQEIAIDGPARISGSYVQDREISTVAGSPKAWRRPDGLAFMRDRKQIAGHQWEAGNRLQEDYQLSQMEAGARSGGASGVRGGGGPTEIPDSAIDASRRLRAAMSNLPAEIETIITLFVLGSSEDGATSFENIAKRVGEDKRAIPLAIRSGLSLLARHYGLCT